MTDLVPDNAHIDRGSVERIIRRAAELQASEQDFGDGLSERELLRLGQDVGIPAHLLQQAILEERTTALTMLDRGLAARVAGPRYVTAQRAIAGPPERLRAALSHWMIEGELLSVKRRRPDSTSWEARQDVWSTIKRGFQAGGRAYRLAQAHEVVGQVARIDDTRCHVRLVADLGNSRRRHVNGGITFASLGAAASGTGLILGVMVPVALAPTALGLLVGWAFVRRRQRQVDEVHVALEQVLDRLEHGEIPVPSDATGARRSGPLSRIADEIRRSLGA